MILNNLKSSLRLALKKPLLPLLNLFGLSLGLGCFLVISLYLYQENSYETAFDEYDRIYRVEENFLSMGQLAWTSPNMPHALNEMPIVEVQTRVGHQTGGFKVKLNEGIYHLKQVFQVDADFLKVFNYTFIQGNPLTALDGPGKAVISDKSALAIFGRTDVVGETITPKDRGDYQITGVVETNKTKSHLDFDLLTYNNWSEYKPNTWFGVGGYSYAKLQKGVSAAQLNEALNLMTEEKVFPVIYAGGLASDNPMSFEEWSKSANRVTFTTKPIRDIYLNSHLQFEIGANGDYQTRMTFTIIGLFILIVASINFMNLTTARASLRVKEIGVKKVLGAKRGGLVRQIIFESLGFTLIAALLGAACSELFIRLINIRLGEVISISLFSRPQLMLWVGISVLLLGVIAGLYPAMFLSRAKMVPLLKGKSIAQVLNLKSANVFRNGLVVVQFVISSALIAASIVVYQQLNHLRKMNLGFVKDQVVVIENGKDLGNNREAFRNELLNMPGVNAASYTARVPADGSNSTLSTLLDSETTLTFAQFYSDEYLPDVLELELVEGEWYDPEKQHYDSVVIINEAAAKAIGLEDPINKVFGNYYRIQGVVKDFHWGGLREAVAPAILFASEQTQHKLAVNINPQAIALTDIESLWSQFSGENLEIEYLDQSFQEQVLKEKQGTDAVLVFTILAIIIACLGLFGLAAFHADQRKHEFGIRRVLGAGFQQLAGLFSLQFVKLVAVAFLISIPLAVYGLQLWLDGFANRVALGVDVFVLSAVFTLAISLLTLLFQSIKVALTNPVETLRNE